MDGIRYDIHNVIKLFGRGGLNYEIYPYYQQNQTIDTYKAYWLKQELLAFLRNRATALETNLSQSFTVKKYDGLIVMISCHGISDDGRECIITSDYALIEKESIHRIFSAKNAKSRGIPRIFLFDCCSGENQRDTTVRSPRINLLSVDSEGEDEEESSDDAGKNIPTLSVVRSVTDETAVGPEMGKNAPERVESVIWALDENNPDFGLITINAANSGFQSKMSCETGSYVVTQLTKRLAKNIYENDNKKFLSKILRSIQNE